MYKCAKDIVKMCDNLKKPIHQIVIMDEIENTGSNEQRIYEKMDEILRVMEHATQHPIDHNVKTLGGLIGGEGRKMMTYSLSKDTLTGDWMTKAMARAFACSEYNASMGKICAAPTAGSSGIIPAALLTVGEKLGLERKAILNALITASGVGKIISKNATVSGAEGGCQAECGSAAAMAAAGLVEMAGGTPEESFHAAAIALKNIMGLICDPIGGLVEAPCSKRNGSGVVNAMVSADMALAGISSIIPFDEVVEAMYQVGKDMHENYKETAKGGIATTLTGLELGKKTK